MLSHERGSKETQFRLGRSILGAIHSGEMVIMILRFLQSPSVKQQHLFFGRVTHLHRFAISLVHFSVTQLDFSVQSIRLFKLMKPC